MIGKSLKKAILPTAFLFIPLNIGNEGCAPPDLLRYRDDFDDIKHQKNIFEPEKDFVAKKFNPSESLDTLVLKYGVDTVSAMPNDGTYYGAKLEQVRTHLASKGYAVDSLFSEPIVIYENLGERFANAKKIADYDEYSRLYKLERKKKDLPKFIEQNKELLDSLEKNSGIPKEITAAIHGMETNFWRYTGHYQAFNVFASMYATGLNPQSALFQMKSLLDFAEKHSLDVKNINSSYAGAIAPCQFMPSNTSTLATGNILEPEHALASTDKYLKTHFKGNFEEMVFAYNHSSFYTKAVIELAESAGWAGQKHLAAK